MKSLKITEELHKHLKLASIEKGLSVQDYLGVIIHIAYAQEPPELVAARDKFFTELFPIWEGLIEASKAGGVAYELDWPPEGVEGAEEKKPDQP